MYEYEVCESFVSINGEGRRAGQLAVFVRFKGCNLSCSYCDTQWANAENAPCTKMTCEQICEYILSSGVKNVTLTGGEPLLRNGMTKLLGRLKACDLRVEAETNGAVDLSPFCSADIRPSFTMDYKLPSSGMEDRMLISNFDLLQSGDCVKFVVGSDADLFRAEQVIKDFDLCGRCGVYLSPVFGAIEPAEIVEFMKKFGLNDVNLQLQLHKFIWEPDKRGV